jgi:thioesterase domain-containing protein
MEEIKGGQAPIVFFPGAGGGAPTLSLLCARPGDQTAFATISYPGWSRYVASDFSPEALIQELSEQVIAIVPRGPICLLGLSLGGHLCYAVALRLRALGREIAGICVIDAFMVSSSAPGEGWVRRAIDDALDLLRKRKYREFAQQVFAKMLRALLRLAGGRLVGFFRRIDGGLNRSADPKSRSLLEIELSMRLLLRVTAPWMADIDRNPVALIAPAALLRTELTRNDDAAWRRRCPEIDIHEIPGEHLTLFDPENIDALRAAFTAATRGWRRG